MKNRDPGIPAALTSPGPAVSTRLAWTIFIWALLVRIVFIVQSLPTPIFQSLSLDSIVYDQIARDLLRGNLFDKAQIIPNVFYAYFLGLIYFLFGPNHLPVMLVQALLDSCSCLLILYIAKTLFNRFTAVLAAVLYAFYGLSVFYSGLVLPSVLAVFLSLASAACLLRGLERRTLSPFFPAGLLLGCAVLAQPHLLPVPLLMPLWFAKGLRCRIGIKRAGKAFAAFAAGLLLVLGMMTLRNYFSAKILSPFAVQGGINFYIGNHPGARGYYQTPPGLSAYPVKLVQSSISLAEKVTGRPFTPAEASRYWFGQGLAFLKTRPRDAAVLYLKKTALFWRAEEIPSSVNFALAKRFTPLFRLPFVSFGWIAPLALIGIFLALKHRQPAGLLFLWIAGQMLSEVIFFVNERYRLPVVPYLIMFAAWALGDAWESFSRRDKKSFIKWAGGFVGLFLLINWPFPFFTQAAAANDSCHYFNLGVAYQRHGQMDKAETAYAQALALHPDFPDVYNNLGLIFEARGEKEKAAAAYQKALAIDPEFPEAKNNLRIISR